MTTTTTNGRVRKSLAEQIDRLDQILDGLANGLNEAVAMVVREAVGDRSVAAHDQSLFDLNAKYADVVSLDETLQYLTTIGHNQPAG